MGVFTECRCGATVTGPVGAECRACRAEARAEKAEDMRDQWHDATKRMRVRMLDAEKERDTLRAEVERIGNQDHRCCTVISDGVVYGSNDVLEIVRALRTGAWRVRLNADKLTPGNAAHTAGALRGVAKAMESTIAGKARGQEWRATT